MERVLGVKRFDSMILCAVQVHSIVRDAVFFLMSELSNWLKLIQLNLDLIWINLLHFGFGVNWFKQAQFGLGLSQTGYIIILCQTGLHMPSIYSCL